MEFDWNLGPLGDGLRCYRREEFFAAHEHWEILWRKSQGAEKSFLQALIQMAGGFHHLQRNNLRGATALLSAALRRLDAYPARFEGLEVAGLREELKAWLAVLEANAANDAAPATGARHRDYPQLCPDVASEGVADSEEYSDRRVKDSLKL
jgi:hypothetical protein